MPLEQMGWKAWLRQRCSTRSAFRAIMGGSKPEEMKAPFYIMVFNKLLAHALYLRYFLAAGALADYNGLHMAALCTQAVCWYSFVRCHVGDPGVVDASTPLLTAAYDNYFEDLRTGKNDDRKKPPKLCHSCHIERPLRSKHCKVARKCVLAFDHYCPYVGNTVGRQNYKYFFSYCLLFLVSAAEWQFLAIVYQRRHGRDMGLVLAQMWFGPFMLFGVAMVFMHLQLTYANLTTNEQINLSRYEYLFDIEGGGYHNLFDKGCWHNFIDRFFPPSSEGEVRELMQIQSARTQPTNLLEAAN